MRGLVVPWTALAYLAGVAMGMLLGAAIVLTAAAVWSPAGNWPSIVVAAMLALLVGTVVTAVLHDRYTES